MHIDFDAFVSAVNEMIASGSGDFYIGLFCGMAHVISAAILWVVLACFGSFLGWLLSRYGKPLFKKSKNEDDT